MIGAHLSATAPLSDIIYNMESLGLETFQVFTRNPRSTKQRYVSDQELALFNTELMRHGVSQFVVHAPYTINPCSPEKSKREFAYKIISEDMQFLSRICGKISYVLHPGHHMGDGAVEGMKRLSDLLHQLSNIPVTICVETMSGAGSELIYSAYEVLNLMNMCRDINVRLTFDTCHVYASGQVLVDAYQLMKRFVQVVHLNGSKNPYQSYTDRHSNLAYGCIPMDWLEGVVKMIDKDIPIILETPSADFLNDIKLLKSFVT